MNPVRNNFVIAGLHHPSGNRDGGCSRIGLAAPPAATGATAESNPRFVSGQILSYFVASDVQLSRVPCDDELGTPVGETGWLTDGSLDAINRGNALRDIVEPGEPRSPFALMIARDPRLDRRQHAQRFFAADLVVTARAVVR